MCGIAGIFGVSGQPAHDLEIKAMCDAMLHRGPDEEGIFVRDNIALGMRRLSIIDVSNGHQPVWNEDRSVCVVLNGEIYNYRELRRTLESRGHQFYTDSDTEVIVHLYEDHGLDCVGWLRGMFAFAVWDTRLQRLMIARDRLGIKPLYFGMFEERLLFASELKALLMLPDVRKDLDWNAVRHLFSFLSTPQDQSIITGVKKLEPGCRLILQAGGEVHTEQYWDVDFTPDEQRSEADTVDSLRDLLEESVRLCMVSDVPVGAFLSGGLDSSSVVALMSTLSDAPVQTFSIGFSEKQYDESHHARKVAGLFDTRHHELILSPDVMSLMDNLAWHLDEPFGDPSAIPTYMVSRLAARHVKVVLSGDGGDEIFAGYDKYLVEQRERHLRWVPAPLRKTMGLVGSVMPDGAKGKNFLRHIALDGSERYLDAQNLLKCGQAMSLFHADVAPEVLARNPWRSMRECLDNPEISANKDWLSALQYLDIKHYLPLDILTKVDRMSMANSLEARVPLLDHKLVEFGATIPASMRLRNGSTKYIFKQAMRGLLPDDIVDRSKQGFAVPLGHWFRGELVGFVSELLLSERSRSRAIFNQDYIRKLLLLHQNGRALDLQLWTLISFELWCRTFLDRNHISSAVQALASKRRAFAKPPQQGDCPELLQAYCDGR